MDVFKWIQENFGHLDVFVNNAGVIKSDFLLGVNFDVVFFFIEEIYLMGPSISEGKTEDFKNIFDVNVISACVCIRESVKLIKANGSFGHIIVINRYLRSHRSFSMILLFFLDPFHGVR